jgi:hypothetical protein
MSTKEDQMPPEARKLARLAVATVLALKLLDRDDIAARAGDGDPLSLNRHTDFVAALSTSLADKLLEKSGL